MTLKGKKMVAEQVQVEETTKLSDQELAAQKAEFLPYLEKKVAKQPGFTFAADMLKKLQNSENLTPNMCQGLRRCILRDEEHEAKKDQAPKPITLKLKPWFARQLDVDSLVITGIVKAESQRAWLVKGHADIFEAEYCVRCGRELTEPASMVIGMGAICAAKTGVPYPKDILAASKTERAAIRKEIEKVLINQKFERWIPKSQALPI